jgi:hypothetical protein
MGGILPVILLQLRLMPPQDFAFSVVKIYGKIVNSAVVVDGVRNRVQLRLF